MSNPADEARGLRMEGRVPARVLQIYHRGSEISEAAVGLIASLAQW